MPRIGIDWYCMRIPYEQKVELLVANSRSLINAVINYQYNTYCRSRCDGVGGRDSLKKRIPCVTRDWGNIDFDVQPSRIPIGRVEKKDGPLIGFMTQNKWGRPHRLLTEGERVQVLAYLDKAMSPCTWDEEVATLKELWDYMQTLTIP